MKTSPITPVIIFISLVVFIACNNDSNVINTNTRTVIGTGSVVADTLNLEAFHTVRNLATFDVEITQGNPQQVILKAQQEILDVITHRVDNGELSLGIQENTSIQTSQGLKAEIIIPEITRVGILGAGNFELAGGHEDILYIDITGTGNVLAYNLDVDTCYITITGVGDCRVKVNNLLNVMITGVGRVYYRGTPQIISNITGVGSIIDDN